MDSVYLLFYVAFLAMIFFKFLSSIESKLKGIQEELVSINKKFKEE